MHVARISRRGNSLGISIPQQYLKELAWRIGDLLVLHTHEGRLIAAKLDTNHIQTASAGPIENGGKSAAR